MTKCPSCNKELSRREVSSLLYIKSKMNCTGCNEELSVDPYYQELIQLGLASPTIHIFLDVPLYINANKKD